MNELQTALIPIAEKAGYEIVVYPGETTLYWAPPKSTGVYGKLPGADGTLTDAEVTVVLGWLLDADYEFTSVKINGRVLFEIEQSRYGDTLNEALVAAVLALPEAT